MARLKRDRPNIKYSPEVQKLATEVGNFIEYWGFKSIHGKVWLHLQISEKPLDAGDLIQRLKVSKALMSLAISDLLEHGVIEKSGKSDCRTDLFRSNPNIGSVVTGILEKREKAMLARMGALSSSLANQSESSMETQGLSKNQLEKLDQLIAGARLVLDQWIEVGALNQFTSVWQSSTQNDIK